MEGYYQPSLPIDDQGVQDMARVSALAFPNTNCFVEIFRGSPESRIPLLEDLFKINMGLVKSKSPEALHCFYKDSARSEVLCSFMLVRSTVSFTLWEKIWAGFLSAALVYGLPSFLRLLQASGWFDQRKEELSGGRNCLELQRMVVNPAYQGQGLGSKFLGMALKEADRLGLPVVLGTQEDRNVTFYSRLGFKLVKEVDYVPGDGNEAYRYKNYFMIREPQQISD